MHRTLGTFGVTVAVESQLRPSERHDVTEVMVDPDALLTWIPRSVLESLGVKARKMVKFVTADGGEITRYTGFVILHAAGTHTADEVVFAEPGDRILLGARSLSGLNLKVDPAGRRLVPRGPILAAVSRRVAVAPRSSGAMVS